MLDGDGALISQVPLSQERAKDEACVGVGAPWGLARPGACSMATAGALIKSQIRPFQERAKD